MPGLIFPQVVVEERERAITSSLKHSTKKVAKGKTKKSDSSHTTLLHDLLNNILEGI